MGFKVWEEKCWIPNSIRWKMKVISKKTQVWINLCTWDFISWKPLTINILLLLSFSMEYRTLKEYFVQRLHEMHGVSFETSHLIPKGPKSLGGQLDVWASSFYINFHCYFLNFFGGVRMYQLCGDIIFLYSGYLEKNLCYAKHFFLDVWTTTSTQKKSSKKIIIIILLWIDSYLYSKRWFI